MNPIDYNGVRWMPVTLPAKMALLAALYLTEPAKEAPNATSDTDVNVDLPNIY